MRAAAGRGAEPRAFMNDLREWRHKHFFMSTCATFPAAL